jgi:hypothetical protein
MVDADGPDPVVLRADGAMVQILFDSQDAVWLRVSSGPSDVRTRPSLDLLRRALAEARGRGVRWLETALEVSAPSTSVLLTELRGRVGRDVTSLVLHRAGSSVMVRVGLSAVPEIPQPSAPTLWVDRLPTQRRGGRSRAVGAGRYTHSVDSHTRADVTVPDPHPTPS